MTWGQNFFLSEATRAPVFPGHNAENSHFHSAKETKISTSCLGYVLQSIPLFTAHNTLKKHLNSGMIALFQALKTSWKIRTHQNQGTRCGRSYVRSHRMTGPWCYPEFSSPFPVHTALESTVIRNPSSVAREASIFQIYRSHIDFNITVGET